VRAPAYNLSLTKVRSNLRNLYTLKSGCCRVRTDRRPSGVSVRTDGRTRRNWRSRRFFSEHYKNPHSRWSISEKKFQSSKDPGF